MLRSFEIVNMKIAYIGGGSRAWARKLMYDLALEPRISGTVALYDIDLEAALQNEKIGNLISENKESLGKWHYVAVSSIEEALHNADFVIISILPGTFKEMESDVHLPEKYGIYQSVGDTVGIGGHLRALRAIPIYIDIANKIKENAPHAWVINYTNPMSICTRILYKIFPEIKAIGCCHEVFGTQKLLADMVKEILKIDRPKRSEIKVNVLGINHFTWIDKASYKNIDLFPLYKEFSTKYYDEGYQNEGNWEADYFASCNRVKFDLFKQYGLIAAAGDRHLAEFMPHIYLRNLETIEYWKFRLTPVKWRILEREQKIKENKKLINGEMDIRIEESGEEGVGIVAALLGLEDLITNVNLPNYGQIKGLPKGAIVETNVLIQKDSVRPIYAGLLPPDLNNLMLRHLYNQESIVEAYLTKNKQVAINAFLNDPMLILPRGQAMQLYDEMLQNTKSYLPEWILK
mgnify:FL=1